MRQHSSKNRLAQDKSGGVNAADADEADVKGDTGEAGVKGDTGASITGGRVP